MAHHLDEEEESVMRRPRWTHILQLLPQLSALSLASKWERMLQSGMQEDHGTTIGSISSKNSLRLFMAKSKNVWESCEEAVSGEERSEVAAALAMGEGDPEENEWRHLLVCFLFALVPSVPNLHRLYLGSEYPGNSMEEIEEALEVLYGALLLPHRPTSSLRHLKLWYSDAYGTDKSCWHLAHLLRSSACNLQTLAFYRVKSLDAAGIKHIARGLQSGSLTKLEIENCSRVGDSGVEVVAALLRTNCTLQELVLTMIDMGEDGLRLLCDALSQSQSTSILNTLDISYNPAIAQGGAMHLGSMLACNPPLLRKLRVINCYLQDEGHLARGLQKNTCLEELDVSYNELSKSGRELLLSHCVLASNDNSSLKKVSMDVKLSRDVKEGMTPPSLSVAKELALMISSNLSIQHLNLTRMYFPSEDWALHILPAVAENQIIQSLDMTGCLGVKGQVVQTALFELLRLNLRIQSIDLRGTPLEKSGKAAAVLEMLRRNKEYLQALSTMPTTKPRSCRIILCGKEYGGKSTLLNTLQLLYARRQCSTSNYQHIKDSWQRLWRSKFRQSDHDEHLSQRTRGIDIYLLRDDDEQGGLRISVWDFAGQREYHALHHFMFPSGNQGAATIFVYTFSPIGIPGHSNAGQVKEHQELIQDFSYWLKFVASNCRPDTPIPQVVVVITNRDRLARKLQVPYKEWQVGVHQTVVTLADQFHGVVSVRSEPPFVVNALDANDPAISDWVSNMEESFRTTLSGLAEVPSICDMVAKASQTALAPIVAIRDFWDICKSNAKEKAEQVLSDRGDKDQKAIAAEMHAAWEVFYTRGDEEWKAVAAYLHDAGEVIYIDSLNFIVQNPRWFGHGILGHLIDLFSQDRAPGHHGVIGSIFTCCFKQQAVKYRRRPQHLGYLNKQVLVELLKDSLKCVPGLNQSAVKVDDLIQLMRLLNLCFEKKSGDPNSGYFLPAIFYDARAAEDKRPLKWRLSSVPDCIVTGRRLECDDTKRTFLTDGFFPLLQVVLHNYVLKEWCDTDICTLEKNLVAIMVNGMEVMVEYSSFGYFVDILIKSTKSHKETMQFVQSHFIDTIRQVCASQEGCPGVSLSEAIIRPACCGLGGKSPVLCAYRKKNQAIPVLELKRMAEKSPNYAHTWTEVVDEQGDEVVGVGKDCAAFLLGEQEDCEDNPPTLSNAPLTKNSLSDMQRIFVTTEDVPMLHKASAWAQFCRVVPMRFHLQCECREGAHKVGHQPGRTFYLVDNESRYALEQTSRQGVILFVASALKMLPVFSGAGSVLSRIPLKDGTPIYRDSIETLSKKVSGKTASQVTVEELRLVVEEDMQWSRSGDWMKAFLDRDSSMDAVQAFKRDFRLTKVQYNVSSSALTSALICDEHYEQDSDMFTRYL